MAATLWWKGRGRGRRRAARSFQEWSYENATVGKGRAGDGVKTGGEAGGRLFGLKVEILDTVGRTKDGLVQA